MMIHGIRYLVLVLSVCAPGVLFAANDIFLGDLPAGDADSLIEDGQAATASAEHDSRLQARQARVNAIHVDIIEQRRQISQLTAQLQAATDSLQREALQSSLATASSQLQRLQLSFEELATGGFAADSLTELSLTDDAGIESGVRDIFKPLIINLQRITERPRRVEQLRSEIDFYQSRLPQITLALNNLGELETGDLSPGLQAGVAGMEERWRRLKVLYTHRLQAAQLQLDEQFSEDESLLGNMGSASLAFLSGRGYNMLLAVAAFTLTMVVIVLLRRTLRGVIGQRAGGAYFHERLFLLLVNVLSVLLAFFVAMGVLYVRGDWLILGILILFLVGIGWSLKSMLPGFMDEARLMLNMGVVREGERVQFRGVAWRVESIGIYSRLVNPLLVGGETRVMLSQLRQLNGRPVDDSEAWFPTRSGDYILLNEDDFAQVVSQSPETVQLRIPGGSFRYFPSADFIAASPVNLSSNGFGLYLHGHLDYRHRYQLTGAIRGLMEKQVRSALEREEFGLHLNNLQVGFRRAERYALGLGVFAAFTPEAAADYIQIRRSLREIIFETCNENGWSLAYSELKVNSGQFMPAVAPGANGKTAASD